MTKSMHMWSLRVCFPWLLLSWAFVLRFMEEGNLCLFICKKRLFLSKNPGTVCLSTIKVERKCFYFL